MPFHSVPQIVVAVLRKISCWSFLFLYFVRLLLPHLFLIAHSHIASVSHREFSGIFYCVFRLSTVDKSFMGSLEALSMAGEDKELTWHDALWEATIEGLLCCWDCVLCSSPAFWRAGVVVCPDTKQTIVLQTCSPKAAKHSSDGAKIWRYGIIALQNRLCLSVQLHTG